MLDVNELRQKRAALVQELRKKNDAAMESGGASQAQEDEMRKIEKTILDVEELISREEKLQQREADLARTEFRNGSQGGRGSSFEPFGIHRGDGSGDYETASQSDFISRDQSFEKHLRSRGLIKQAEFERLTFGQLMRAAVTGPRSDIERRALAEGTDSAGGYTVPDVVLSRFIDKMRAATVAIRAGAQTIPLTSDKTVIARTATDPAAAWRVENAAVTISDGTYEAAIFQPKSLAVIVKVSRELLEDSLNIEAMLEASFAGSMAAELDRVALVGSGVAPEPLGISGTSNVGSVTSVGTPADYTKFVDGLYELWLDNEPTCSAIVLHPRTLKTLSNLATGITSDKTPLQKPAVLENIPIMQTTSLPINLGGGTNESIVVLGNFARLLIGIRSALRVEILRELYAGNHQYGFVAHLRADIAVEHPESFAVLSGVTA